MSLDGVVVFIYLFCFYGVVFCLKRGMQKIRYWGFENVRYIGLILFYVKIDCFGFYYDGYVYGVIKAKIV